MNLDIEYGDFYKFITSLGIGLIGLAILAPWLFLREPFDLLTKQEDIEALTPIAQTIVANRQMFVGQVITFIPWFSGISIVIGLVLLILGSYLWRTKNQILLDKQNELAFAKLLREFEPATKQQIKSKIREEVVEDEKLEQAKAVEVSEPTILRIARIKEIIAEKLELCFASRYRVLSNQRLGGIFFDILLASGDFLTKDIIIEIKYVRHHLNYLVIQGGFLQIANIKNAYAEESNRLALGYLLIIMPKEVMSNTNLESYQEKIRGSGSIFKKAKTYLIHR